jgi:hypothetical protein
VLIVLERVALDILSLDETTLEVGVYAILVLAFVAALISQQRSPDQLERAPYFALTMLLVLIASGLQFIWLLTLEALTSGVLWLLVLATIASLSVLGWLFGKLAAARSRSAFGSQRFAFLGLIPLANLVLVFYPPKEWDAPQGRLASAFLGLPGVVVGLILLLCVSVADRVAAGALERFVADVESDPSATRARLEAVGVEEALRIAAEQSQSLLPAVVDEVTTLIEIEASGSTLRRTYVMTVESLVWTEEMSVQIGRFLCDEEGLRAFLDHGATIEERYLSRSRRPLKTESVTAASCI